MPDERKRVIHVKTWAWKRYICMQPFGKSLISMFRRVSIIQIELSKNVDPLMDAKDEKISNNCTIF